MTWAIEKFHLSIDEISKENAVDKRDTEAIHKLIDELFECNKDFNLPEPGMGYSKEDSFSFFWYITPLGGYKFRSGFITIYFWSFLFLNEEDQEGGVPEISIGTGNSVKNTEYNPHNLKLAFKQCKEFIECNELIE